MSSLVLVPYPNWLSFFIFTSGNGDLLTISDVGNVSVLVLEHLPPVGAGAVVLQVVGFTGVVDVDRLVSWSRSNSS